jgi:uncharacterized protein involved in response to NO
VNRTTLKPYADEPYRIFFPVALLAGVLGVMLWPLFYAGGLSSFPDVLKLSFYPNFAHAHVMIQGFVGGFAIGFTGTALPKMVWAKTLHPWQLLTLLGLHISLCVFHLMGYTRVGDALFTAMMVMMLACLGIRLAHGKSMPPPGMVLAGMGLISGTVGAAWMAIMGLNGDAFLYSFFQRLLYQAFILLPLLGIGGYIFPMILGTPNEHAKLGGPKMTKEWEIKAIEGGVVGFLIIISYWVEAHSGSAGLAQSAQAMAWVRLLLCFVWITKESGWLKRNTTKGVMAFALRAGIFCLLGGMIAHAILQKNKIALDHSLYIGGFGLITMMVATRVLYGHSGQGQKFKLWTKPLTITTGLVLFTMLTRVTADFLPNVIISHHVYAALLWVSVSIVWGIALLPSVRKQPAPSILPKNKKVPSMMDMNFRK